MTKTTLSKFAKTAAVVGAGIFALSAATASASDLSFEPAMLETEAGVVEVYKSLEKRASDACETRRAGTKMHDRKVVKVCTSRVVDMLVEKIGDPRLAAYHAQN